MAAVNSRPVKRYTMKFFASLILMAALSFAACLYLPWWSIAPACFLVALLIRQKPGWAMLAGFLSLFLLWAGLAYWISRENGQILAHKMSILILQKDNPGLLVLITGAIGGVVGAFAALSGGLLRSLFKPKD